MRESGQTERIRAWMRPLSMSSITPLPFGEPIRVPSDQDVIRDLCDEKTGDVLDGIKARCARLCTGDIELLFVPAEKRILEKLVWPLRSAKKAFCLADFLGCIALCGMVCEMAVVFVYDLIELTQDVQRLPDEHRQIMAKRKYERLGQEKRVKYLVQMGAIPTAAAEDAETVRKLRKEYMHFLSKSLSRVEEDAYVAYACAARILRSLIGLSLSGSGISVPPHLERYVANKKLITWQEQI